MELTLLSQCNKASIWNLYGQKYKKTEKIFYLNLKFFTKEKYRSYIHKWY